MSRPILSLRGVAVAGVPRSRENPSVKERRPAGCYDLCQFCICQAERSGLPRNHFSPCNDAARLQESSDSLRLPRPLPPHPGFGLHCPRHSDTRRRQLPLTQKGCCSAASARSLVRGSEKSRRIPAKLGGDSVVPHGIRTPEASAKSTHANRKDAIKEASRRFWMRFRGEEEDNSLGLLRWSSWAGTNRPARSASSHGRSNAPPQTFPFVVDAALFSVTGLETPFEVRASCWVCQSRRVAARRLRESCGWLTRVAKEGLLLSGAT